MCEKSTISKGDLHIQWGSQRQNHTAEQEIAPLESKNWRRFMPLLQLCIVILGLLVLGHKFPQWWTPENHANTSVQPYASYVPLSMPSSAAEYETCGRYVKQEKHFFEFNISTDHSNRWQLLDTADSETRSHLLGRIRVAPGPESQSSDIRVEAVLSTNDEADLDRLVLRESKDSLIIEYDVDETLVDDDLCSEVVIFVYLRPDHDQTIDLFEVRSNILDIMFEAHLFWEVHNFISHTSYGDIDVMAFQPSDERMTAHNISLSSVYGGVGGPFMAPRQNLILQNEDGYISIELFPDFYNMRTLDQTITMSTVSGDIELLGWFNMPWPSGDYTHRLSISTDSGAIHSQAPHGSVTNITSNSGDIRFYSRPYGTTDRDAQSEIYATTQSGKLKAMLSEAEVGEGQHNPNHNMISEHSAAYGEMKLNYGYDWEGELEADIDHGVLNFDGSSLGEVERGENYVKAKRGKSGKSHINAHVGEGKLDVGLGLWS